MGNVSVINNIESLFQLADAIVDKVELIKESEGKVILIADDEPLTFELIKEYFGNANLHYKILRAETGRKAYNLAVSELPDLIITDWIMPEFDGPDLIKKLKENNTTKDIPVILITGGLFPEKQFNKVFFEGAIDYIRKPLDETELITRVTTWLSLNKPLRDLKRLTPYPEQ